MPKFVTIGYGDREGYDLTPPAIRDAAHAQDAKLREHGVLMGIAGAPVQVRNHQAVRVQTSEGSFMASAMPVAGFAVIEAPDLAQAIDIVSQPPVSCALRRWVEPGHTWRMLLVSARNNTTPGRQRRRRLVFQNTTLQIQSSRSVTPTITALRQRMADILPLLSFRTSRDIASLRASDDRRG